MKARFGNVRKRFFIKSFLDMLKSNNVIFLLLQQWKCCYFDHWYLNWHLICFMQLTEGHLVKTPPKSNSTYTYFRCSILFYMDRIRLIKGIFFLLS